jgi:hypothetical protein
MVVPKFSKILVPLEGSETNDGKLWHGGRSQDGSWGHFGDVTLDVNAGHPGLFINISVASVIAELHAIGASGTILDILTAFGITLAM